VARDPRRPRGRCVASPCVRYATPPRTSGLREHDESRERDGEPPGSLGMILLRYLRFAAARAERYTVSAMHILAGVFRVEH
jgi:hypothetical protein